ncbi:MAG: ComEA family DNA-binding protein [Patescibacteria group bacterium]|nr:ComEA family DNA-binding protein [Patescibacteria group bacterium]
MLEIAQQAREKYLPFIKQNRLPLALGLIGLTLFAYGLISLLSLASNKTDSAFAPAKQASEIGQVSPQANSQKIVVDVEGAVVKPGIYSLALGSRVQEALVLALGLSQAADRNWVEKNLNLAVKLTDGAKIYIPRLGEAQNNTTNVVGGVSSATDVLGANALINVNTATSSELDALPGVGPVTAEKIINNRPYASVDDLLSKKAVNSKVFSQIKDKVTVN